MPKRLIDLNEADDLNNGEDLLYIRQASGSRRDRKITTLELLKGIFSSLGGVTDSWTAATMGAAKILAQRTILGTVEHAWIDLPTLFTDKLAPLVNGLAGEVGAREDADTSLENQIATEAGKRAADDAVLTSGIAAAVAALGAQQLYVRTFSNGLADFFPLAVPEDSPNILSQSRIVHHRNADGKTVYAELLFHWSATFAGSANAGWTIPDASDALGAYIDSALREVWGIGPADEWRFPYIHGTLQCAAKLYTISIYHQVTGPLYSIQGWDQAANRLPFGDLRFTIPGELLG